MHRKPEEEIYARLKRVLDPELNVDIVNLGLIYKVEAWSLDDGLEAKKEQGSTQADNTPRLKKIKITMTLTTPGCPLAPVINKMVRDAVFDLVEDPDEDVQIDLTFDPPWTPDMMDENTKLELGL